MTSDPVAHIVGAKFKGAAEPALPGRSRPAPRGQGALATVGFHVPQDVDHAIVEFVARSKLGGKAERLHETSRFVREGGRWYYVELYGR